ncbi:MAG: IS110 family transposase [Candidatus Paceibacterota bacterium]|jgi:transposase
MDLHKKTSTFVVKEKFGRVLEKKKLNTDREEITDFLSPYQGAELVVEPVSQWYVYADLIQKLGINVHLAHPMKVKAIAFAKVKTDSIDAGVLCDLLRADLLPEAYFSPKEVRTWKETARFRVSLVQMQTQTKNKIHSILFKNAIISPHQSLFGTNGREWLKKLSLPEPFAFHLTEYLKLLDDIALRIEEAEKEVIMKVSNHPQAKLLCTIPGIGYISALTIIAEIGDIHRFVCAKKLMGYAGLVPSTYSSGDKVRHGKITRLGSMWLRTILIECAHRQPRYKQSGSVKDFYDHILLTKEVKTAAVATARKLCAVIWRMLMDNRPFEKYPPKRDSKKLTVYASSPRTEVGR